MTRKLYLNEILYISHQSRRTDFVTTNCKFYMYCPMKSIKEYLSDDFYFCGNNLIINLEKVISVESCEVIFENESKVQISRSVYVPLKQFYAAYLIEKRQKKIKET